MSSLGRWPQDDAQRQAPTGRKNDLFSALALNDVVESSIRDFERLHSAAATRLVAIPTKLGACAPSYASAAAPRLRIDNEYSEQKFRGFVSGRAIASRIIFHRLRTTFDYFERLSRFAAR
jgi:hypothetical protein